MQRRIYTHRVCMSPCMYVCVRDPQRESTIVSIRRRSWPIKSTKTVRSTDTERNSFRVHPRDKFWNRTEKKIEIERERERGKHVDAHGKLNLRMVSNTSLFRIVSYMIYDASEICYLAVYIYF